MNAFERVSQGRTATLFEAAMEFAVDEYPDLDIPLYLEQLRLMTDGLRCYPRRGNGAEDRLDGLNQYFFEELRFAGNLDHYYDPRNSYLNEVINRRLGIPISLGVVYQALASAMGLQLRGVNFPGRFLLCPAGRFGDTSRPWYIDLLQRGRRLTWEQCLHQLGDPTTDPDADRLHPDDFPPMTDRDILTRMLRNLKGIYARGDLRRCLRIQERIVQLNADLPNEVRDLGILYFLLGKPAYSMRTLQELLDRHPSLKDEEAVSGYLKRATQAVILLN